MSFSAAFSCAIVCEGAADMRTGADLADRVLVSEVDWISPETLIHLRRWRGLEEDAAFLAWRRTPALAREHDIKVHGAFGKLPDYRAARSALFLFLKLEPQPDAVILLRDSDGDLVRKESLERARLEMSPGTEWPFPIIVGVAHTKRECWVLAGFEPRSEAEEEALAELRQELGFDPRVQAENLTAAQAQAQRNAKRVLDRLVGGSQEREEDCWASCDLEILAQRGRLTGLTEYVEEIRGRLVPLFTNRIPEAGP